MVAKFMVLEEYPSQWGPRKGTNVTPHLLALADMSEGARLTHTLEFELPNDQIEHKGKLRGKSLEIGLRGFRAFGNKVIADGTVISGLSEPKPGSK